MTALVCFHNRFDPGAFLKGEYDDNPGQADAFNLLVVTHEEEVFAVWNGGGLERFPKTEDPVIADRLFHVDEKTGEMWTLNPDSGAALSSATWDEE